MIYDSRFKQLFLNYVAERAKSNIEEGTETYKIIYNLIKSGKLQFDTNIALINFEKGKSDKIFKSIGILTGTISNVKDKVMDTADTIFKPFKYNPPVEKDEYDPRLDPTSDEFDSEALPDKNPPKQISKTFLNTVSFARDIIGKAFDFSIDAKIKMRGGYDTYRKKLIFKLWLYTGYDILNNKYLILLHKTYGQILAGCLYEGLFFYNYQTNGSLLNNLVTDWYKTYFTITCMQYTNRTTAAKVFGNKLGELWAKYIFENMEKYTLLNQNLPIRQMITKGREKNFISGDILIEEILMDVIKKALAEVSKYNLDYETSNELMAYSKELITFVGFMYKNRNQKLDPKDIATVEETGYEDDGRYKISKSNGKALGFNVVGHPGAFNEAYKVLGLKKVYGGADDEKAKFFKDNFVYSELFMPTTILAKRLFFSITSNDTSEGLDLKLLDCGLKGLNQINSIG